MRLAAALDNATSRQSSITTRVARIKVFLGVLEFGIIAGKSFW